MTHPLNTPEIPDASTTPPTLVECIATFGRDGRWPTGGRVRCPRCGSVVAVERHAPRDGVDVYRAACLDLSDETCSWSMRVLAPEGRPAEELVEEDAEAEKKDRRFGPGVSATGHRPACLVATCRQLAAEAGFCTGHLSMWKFHGSPSNRAAWAASLTQPAKQQPAASPSEPAAIEPPEDPPEHHPKKETPMPNPPPVTDPGYADLTRAEKMTFAFWKKANPSGTFGQWLDQGKPSSSRRGAAAKRAKPTRKPSPKASNTGEPSIGQPVPVAFPGPAGGFAVVDLAAGRYRVGLLGRFVTLLAPDGRVVYQIPAEAA